MWASSEAFDYDFCFVEVPYVLPFLILEIEVSSDYFDFYNLLRLFGCEFSNYVICSVVSFDRSPPCSCLILSTSLAGTLESSRCCSLNLERTSSSLMSGLVGVVCRTVRLLLCSFPLSPLEEVGAKPCWCLRLLRRCPRVPSLVLSAQ